MSRSEINNKDIKSNILNGKWNGYPDFPELSGWHWVDDADGLRPLLWRGDDWPDKIDQGSWEDRYSVLCANDLSGWNYYGKIMIPDNVEFIFHSRLMNRSCQGGFYAP